MVQALLSGQKGAESSESEHGLRVGRQARPWLNRVTTNAVSTVSGEQLAGYGYRYAAVGNATTIVSGGSQAPATTLRYQHDAANQPSPPW